VLYVNDLLKCTAVRDFDCTLVIYVYDSLKNQAHRVKEQFNQTRNSSNKPCLLKPKIL